VQKVSICPIPGSFSLSFALCTLRCFSFSSLFRIFIHCESDKFVEQEAKTAERDLQGMRILHGSGAFHGTIRAIWSGNLLRDPKQIMTTRKPETKPFSWRAFVTFYVVLSFLVIAVTGVVLFITPPATPIGGGSGYGRKSVAALCEESGISVDEGIARLGAAGLSAEAGTTIRTIAQGAGMPPADVVAIIQGQPIRKEE
jgi:hypothetical protein